MLANAIDSIILFFRAEGKPYLAVRRESYEDLVRSAEEIAAGAPAVVFRCLDLGDFAVKLRAIVWSPDMATGAEMLSDLRLSIKKRFDEAGIEIPYPYQNLVIRKNDLDA